MQVRRFHPRSAATTVEFAIIASIVVLLLLGLIIGGFGVYRYQEMAHLAREAARYAATHGGDYAAAGQASRTGVPAVASSSDLIGYVRAKAVGLDPDKLTVTVTWSAPSSVKPANTPSYVDTDPTLVPPGQKVIRNYVSVTVSYQWQPELFLFSPITLTSTSTMPMSY